MNTIAAILQLLVGLAFVTIPYVRHKYGATASANAEAEMRRQGVPVTVLKENKISFDASGHETAVPVTVAAIMAVLALLNLSGNHWGEVLSWVFQPLVLAGNCLILYSQLTAAKSVAAAFERKGDPVLKQIDIKSLLKAAESGFPRWVMPILQNIRHTTVMAASTLTLLTLLAN